MRDPVSIPQSASPATAEPQPPDTASLLAAATAAAAHAYAPYSGFRVGAAILLASGAVVTAANVENASYGLTLCAERAALVRAVAEHGPQLQITAVAIANLNHAASPPCGACRQVLAEFCSPQTRILFPLLSAHTGTVEPHNCSFGELFPFTFDLPPSRNPIAG